MEQHFGQIKATYDNVAVPSIIKCRYTGSDIRVRDDAMPLAHIAFVIESPGYEHPDNLALNLCASVSSLNVFTVD